MFLLPLGVCHFLVFATTAAAVNEFQYESHIDNFRRCALGL
jgi:hypothetical protein